MGDSGRRRGGRWLAAGLSLAFGACGDAKAPPDDEGGPALFTARARPAEAGAPPDGLVGPTATGVERRAILELAALNACLRAREASAAEHTRALGARFGELGLTLATYTAAMERLTRDATFQQDLLERARSCPAAPDPQPVAEAAQAAPEARPEGGGAASGTWTGAIRGELTGAVRLVLEGGVVTAATLTVGDETGRLQGRLVSAREVTLGGRLAGGDAIRLELRLDADGRRAEGTWDAVVDGRQRKGAVTLTR